MISWVNYFSRVHYQWIVRIWIILKFNFIKTCHGYSLLAAFWPLKILAFDLGGEIFPQLHLFIGFFATVFDVATTITIQTTSRVLNIKKK